MVSFVPCTVTRGYKKPPGTRFPSPLRAPPALCRDTAATRPGMCVRERPPPPAPRPCNPALQTRPCKRQAFALGNPCAVLLCYGPSVAHAPATFESVWHEAGRPRCLSGTLARAASTPSHGSTRGGAPHCCTADAAGLNGRTRHRGGGTACLPGGAEIS
jgi:hypothetical protein